MTKSEHNYAVYIQVRNSYEDTVSLFTLMILRVKIYEESFKFSFIKTNVFHNFFYPNCDIQKKNKMSYNSKEICLCLIQPFIMSVVMQEFSSHLTDSRKNKIDAHP